jgi:DNA recombination protein RmuC
VSADTGNLLIVVGIGFVALLAVGIFLMVARSTRSSGEFRARLDLLARDQDAKNTLLSQRLLDHERAISERLIDVGRRVGETLEKSGQHTTATMADLRERLVRIDVAQKNIAELSSRVVSLQDILQNKQARGAFGEFQLNRLIADALPPDAYAFEVTLSNGRRADCVIALPNPPGPVVIDAKFPLEGYRAMMRARDEATAREARKVFTASITKHITDIAERYIVPGETAEAAMLFLPSEAIYMELQTHFRPLVEDAYRKRVYIVSPTTLWGALATMRAVFRDVRLREQAHIIQAEMQNLLKDVGLMDERVTNLSRHFDQATEDLRQIRISSDKVAKRAVRIQELEFDETGAATATPVESAKTETAPAETPAEEPATAKSEEPAETPEPPEPPARRPRAGKSETAGAHLRAVPRAEPSDGPAAKAPTPNTEQPARAKPRAERLPDNPEQKRLVGI